MAEMNLPEVEYRESPEFPGYRFGNDGTVWTCWRKGKGAKGVIGNEWRLKAASPATGGRLMQFLVMIRDGKRELKMVLLHRLILTIFVGPCPDGMEACHNNGDPSDNRLCNLRWDTRKNNHADKHAHGTWQAGQANPNALLTNQQADEMRAIHASTGASFRELGSIFGVSKSTAGNIVRNRCYVYHLDETAERAAQACREVRGMGS